MDKMIYCQRDIPKDKWRYGFRSSAVTGCGWIAVYNALRIMGYKPTPAMVIKYFEQQIPLLNGNTGTFVLSPAMFFKRFNFPVNVTANTKKFDDIAQRSDACILYFWWRNKAKIGAHFVALHHTEKGFVGYNTYRNSKGPDSYGKSLQQFIKNRKYFGAVLIGINNRE
ncbi:MAG: hypothetical protein E7483_03670 [Ruminococcaceae bacterium]|nr:hypothetical protein [Oscillospiraceae bacterium]